MTKYPRVSIVIPTYERETLLKDTLRSATNQRYEGDLEIVVVDGSSEYTAEPIVERYSKAQYVNLREHHPPFDTRIKDVAAARSIGVRFASGTYVQFLDDDDVLVEENTRKKVRLLEDPERGNVVGSAHRDAEGTVHSWPRSIRGKELAYALVTLDCPCAPSVLMAERALLANAGPFHELPHDSLGMFIEVAKRTVVEYIDEPLMEQRRSHELSTSRQYLEAKLETYERYRETGLYDTILSEGQRDKAAENYENVKSRVDHREESASSIHE